MPDSHVALLARRLLDDGAVDTALQAFVAAQLLLDAADALGDESRLLINTDKPHTQRERCSTAED